MLVADDWHWVNIELPEAAAGVEGPELNDFRTTNANHLVSVSKIYRCPFSQAFRL
jgi:hypothetical protein